MGLQWVAMKHCTFRKIFWNVTKFKTLASQNLTPGLNESSLKFSVSKPTVSLSDVFTSFGLQTLLWKHHAACCWSYSKLRKTLAFHKYMPPVCLPSTFFAFPNSQLIPKCTKHCVFTGKCNLCVSRPVFSYSLIHPNSQLIPNCKKMFSQGKSCMCLSSHFFLLSNSQLIPTCAKHCVFTGRCACLSRPIFSYSLIHD